MPLRMCRLSHIVGPGLSVSIPLHGSWFWWFTFPQKRRQRHKEGQWTEEVQCSVGFWGLDCFQRTIDPSVHTHCKACLQAGCTWADGSLFLGRKLRTGGTGWPAVCLPLCSRDPRRVGGWDPVMVWASDTCFLHLPLLVSAAKLWADQALWAGAHGAAARRLTFLPQDSILPAATQQLCSEPLPEATSPPPGRTLEWQECARCQVSVLQRMGRGVHSQVRMPQTQKVRDIRWADRVLPGGLGLLAEPDAGRLTRSTAEWLMPASLLFLRGRWSAVTWLKGEQRKKSNGMPSTSQGPEMCTFLLVKAQQRFLVKCTSWVERAKSISLSTLSWLAKRTTSPSRPPLPRTAHGWAPAGLPQLSTLADHWRVSSKKWLSSILRFLLSPQDWSFSFSFFSTCHGSERNYGYWARIFPGRVRPELFYSSVFNTVAGSPHLLKECRMTQHHACVTQFQKCFSILMLH